MFDIMQSKHVRDNEDTEGLGIRYDSNYGRGLIEQPLIHDGLTLIEPFIKNYYSIEPNDTRTVTFTPLSGIIQQSKLIPLKYCPLTFEVEVCNALCDPIISPQQVGWNTVSVAEQFGESGLDEYSINWQIENPVIKCDVCRMDNELDNQFAQRFLSGQTIPISYSTFVVQQQAIAGKTPSINITRALSRLKSVFLTSVGKPGDVVGDDVLGTYPHMFLKDWNDFYHPMASSTNYGSNQEFEVSLQIGGKRFPEYPLRSQAETYSALRKCLGIQQSSFHSIDINPYEYGSHKFVIGIDTEKVLQASFSSENIKTGLC
jgi:hypothetical protein